MFDYDSVATTRPGKAAKIVGWILTILTSLFMGGLGLVMLIFQRPMIIDDFRSKGFADPEAAAVIVLGLKILSVLICLIPKTAVLGAVLLTGYLGGAIATHLCLADCSGMIPAIVIGVIVWLALFLREPRLRRLLPLRK